MDINEQFIQAMRDAVAERGRDYVYPLGNPDYALHDSSCVYSTPDGTPACLIGLALSKVMPEAVPEYDAPTETADELLLPLGFSQIVADAAFAAQTVQDTERTWGLALDVFEDVLADAATV